MTFPVHSASGVLLVGAGSTFTAEIRDKLRDRGIHKVIIRESDLAKVTVAPPVDDEELEAAESEVNRRVEDFIRQGLMQVRNNGPAVAGSVVQHGATDYAVEIKQQAEAHQSEQTSQVASMLENVSKGANVEIGQLNAMASSSIQLLSGDFASTLSTAFEGTGKQPLAEHAVKMATLGMALGVEMGYDFENVRKIGIAGMLADLGMAKVPEQILLANQRLTNVEFHSIQKHVIHTANLVQKMDGIPTLVALVVYQIHEKSDGSGYPRGRTHKNIHPFARVLHVADAYTAMTSDRPDRPRMMGNAAMEQLLQQARHHKVDPEVVRALLRCLSLCPVGSNVALSDGSAGRVIRAQGDEYAKPIVRRYSDRNGNPIAKTDQDAVVDLTKSDLSIVQAIANPHSNEISVDVRSDSVLSLDEVCA